LPTIANKTVNWIFPVQLPIAKRGKKNELRIAKQNVNLRGHELRISEGEEVCGVCVVEWIKSVFIIALIKNLPSLLYHISLSLLLNTNKNGRAKWPRRKSRKPQQIE